MIHKKCGGEIVLDCSSMYVIQSPSLKITSRGVLPGVIQIDYAKTKTSPKLSCSLCKDSFDNKTSFEEEITDVCCICRKHHSPKNLHFVENFSFVCVECLTEINHSSTKVNEKQNKLLMYYGDALRGKEFPTLLTILMKR